MLIQKAQTQGKYEAIEKSPITDGILRIEKIAFGSTHYEAIQKCINKVFNIRKYPDSFISEKEQKIHEYF